MMKRTLTAAALAVVLAAPAFAQSTMPDSAAAPQMNNTTMQPQMKDSAAPASTMSAPTSTATTDQIAFVQQQNASDWRGSKLIGASVYGQDNKSIGDINDVLIANDGRINAVVIGVGGFLGVGEKNVAVPFEKLSVARKADSASIDKITVSYTKDELKNAPKFAYYEPTKSSTTGSAVTDKNAPMAPTPGSMKK